MFSAFWEFLSSPFFFPSHRRSCFIIFLCWSVSENKSRAASSFVYNWHLSALPIFILQCRQDYGREAKAEDAFILYIWPAVFNVYCFIFKIWLSGLVRRNGSFHCLVHLEFSSFFCLEQILLYLWFPKKQAYLYYILGSSNSISLSLPLSPFLL